MTAMFHEVREQRFVACDTCGAAVAVSEHDRGLHSDWHTARSENVIDLASAETHQLPA